MIESIRRLVLASETLSVEGSISRPVLFRWIVIKTGSGGKLVCLCWVGAGPLPAVVAKFARNPEGNARIEAEQRALVTLQLYDRMTNKKVPRPLGSTALHSRLVTLESAIPGRPLRTYLHEHRGKDGALARQERLVQWLTTLGALSTRPAEAADMQRLVLDPFERAFEELELSQDESNALSRLYASAREMAGERSLPTVFTHNDLGTPNVMVDKRGDFKGVIDWESGGRGLPATDLIYFLGRFAYETRGSTGADELKGYREIFFEGGSSRGGSDSALAREWLHRYCAQVGVAIDWLPVLVGLCWIMHARNEGRQVAMRRDAHLTTTGAGMGVAENHFGEHLRFYLRNVARFREAIGPDLVSD